MKQRAAFIGLGLAVVGCGASGPCQARNGSYVITFSEQSGTCGPQSDGVVNVDGSGSPPTGCTGGSTASVDNCKVDVNETCPFNGTDSVTEVGQVTWSSDGSNGSGVIQLTETDGSGTILCSGTYEAHYQRQ